MESYEDVVEFYDKNYSIEEDEPPCWHDLPYEVQYKIQDAFLDYKKEYIEWEEWFYRPMSYYGVSR